METCSPVSQAGPRDTGDLEGWFPEQQWEPDLGSYLIQNCISITQMCHLGMTGSMCTKETEKGMWATPATASSSSN